LHHIIQHNRTKHREKEEHKIEIIDKNRFKQAQRF